jgi:hypothetical protein
MRIREIISTYMASDKRMKLDDDKVLALLIHNILNGHCRCRPCQGLPEPPRINRREVCNSSSLKLQLKLKLGLAAYGLRL